MAATSMTPTSSEQILSLGAGPGSADRSVLRLESSKDAEGITYSVDIHAEAWRGSRAGDCMASNADAQQLERDLQSLPLETLPLLIAWSWGCRRSGSQASQVHAFVMLALAKQHRIQTRRAKLCLRLLPGLEGVEGLSATNPATIQMRPQGNLEVVVMNTV